VLVASLLILCYDATASSNLIIFKMADGAILDLVTRKVPKLKNNHFRVFGMPVLVEIDTLIVHLAHLGPEM